MLSDSSTLELTAPSSSSASAIIIIIVAITVISSCEVCPGEGHQWGRSGDWGWEERCRVPWWWWKGGEEVHCKSRHWWSWWLDGLVVLATSMRCLSEDGRDVGGWR